MAMAMELIDNTVQARGGLLIIMHGRGRGGVQAGVKITLCSEIHVSAARQASIVRASVIE